MRKLNTKYRKHFFRTTVDFTNLSSRETYPSTGWTVGRTRKNLDLKCEFRVGLRKNTLTSWGLERISQQCFFIKRTPRFAPFSIFVGENTSLKTRKEVTDYICSVVGMFYFYTRKWNPIIMIILLSCACHTHRHMHHHTLSMSWLYSLQQTSAVGFEEICGKRKYKCVIPKIQDTNQIASFDSIGCFANIALLVKQKMELA